jgi:hypothetical protein
MFGYEVKSIMGYELKTTFWGDFTVADAFGEDAIKDTYKQSFTYWKNDVEYVTELAMVLNWKCWQHWEQGNHELGELYHDLYFEVRNWCYENLKGDDLQYYFETTD